MSAIDNDILEKLAAHKDEIKEKYNVASLEIFGSFSKGTANKDSDIDLLVRFSKTPGIFSFLDLKRYLEDVLGRPVDLVTEKALKKQLREKIMREAVRVA